MSEQNVAAREAWRREWRRMRERNASQPQHMDHQAGTLTITGVTRTVVVQLAGLHPAHRAALVLKAIATVRGER